MLPAGDQDEMELHRFLVTSRQHLGCSIPGADLLNELLETDVP